MWSQWVWLIRIFTGGFVSTNPLPISLRPSSRRPDPASMMRVSSPDFASRQAVLPPAVPLSRGGSSRRKASASLVFLKVRPLASTRTLAIFDSSSSGAIGVGMEPRTPQKVICIRFRVEDGGDPNGVSLYLVYRYSDARNDRPTVRSCQAIARPITRFWAIVIPRIRRPELPRPAPMSLPRRPPFRPIP